MVKYQWWWMVIGVWILAWIVFLGAWQTSSLAQTPQIRAELAWDDLVNTTHQGYILSRKLKPPGGVSTAYTVVANNISRDSRAYTDAGLQAGTEYCYTIAAFNALGRSAESNETCLIVPTLPEAIVNLRVTLSVTFTIPPVGQ